MRRRAFGVIGSDFYLFLLQKRVSVKRSYGRCDWGRTHIAVERKHTEWRDHHTNQNVAPKGVPPLSSVPHEMHTAHPAREESVHRAPQRWALMISPLCICRRCGRDGRRGRCRRAGTQGQKQDRGGYTVSGYVSQVWEEVWEVSGADAVPTARADASRLRTLRSMPLYWFFLGSGARVLGAAWGSADRRPGGATAPETATQAAAAARARPAPARCLVLGRCRSPAPYCGSMASSATWSACRAKVPGQDALRTAIQGRGRVLRPRARAAALRRVRPPRRREGLFVCVR